MVKVNVVAVGRVKEKYFADGISEYAKRIGKFANFSIIEVAEENFAKVDAKAIETIKERECERIFPHLKGQVYAMAIEGKKISSESFAKEIKSLVDKGEGVITFVIGGSYGLDDKIKEKADKIISF